MTYHTEVWECNSCGRYTLDRDEDRWIHDGYDSDFCPICIEKYGEVKK